MAVCLCLLGAAVAGGCEFLRPPPEPQPQTEDPLRVDPLPVQQAQAYGETVTGLFMSLVDFETAPGREAGHKQVGFFSFTEDRQDNSKRFVVNVTRTGAGAMEVTTAPGVDLIFTIPYLRDFTAQTLLTFALYSESLRDDLRVRLSTDSASWTSHRTLVREGWNYVLIDIQRLADAPQFDITSVRTMRIGFADAIGPVRFNIDDIMLVNNRRAIEGLPAGMTLVKKGLNYALAMPKMNPPMTIAQYNDGLWRLSPYQAAVQVLAPGAEPVGDREDLDRMGARRVGLVEILEKNPVRLRMANTWLFPERAGEWLSMAIRQIRWEYTFYPDGRWVTHVELNNAGGKELASLKISFDREVALTGSGIERHLLARGLRGPIGRWSCLWCPQDDAGRQMQENYLSPGKLTVTLGDAGAFAPGDGDHDRFDQSQGCYFVKAHAAGHCRFRIVPAANAPLARAVFRIAGRWQGKVYVTSEGLRIRRVVRLSDGSILFVLPGEISRETAVEVTGKVPLLAG